jgi:antitoxin CptB
MHMDHETRLKCLKFRAEHRGTREADMLVGGFFARYAAAWSEAECEWFEAFLEEQDADIMAWAMAVEAVPPRWQGDMMRALQRLDYIRVAG